MSVSMNEFVAQWGYIAVFLGSLIEGESIILPAGYFASTGVLSLPKIMLVAFVGTLIADQSLFFVGHFWGQKALQKFPRLALPADKAFKLLHQYNTLFILSFRFIYGIRIVSPVVIGTAGVSIRRFAILNVIAAALWSVMSCSLGYFFGDFLMNRLTPLQRFWVLGGGGILLLGALLWKVVHWLRTHESGTLS